MIRTFLGAALVSALLCSPAAPAETLSADDAREFSAALKAVDHQDARRFERHKDDVKNKVARKVLDWYRVSKGGFGADFEEIVAFAKAHPDWPYQGRIRARAEEALDARKSAKFVVDWFKEAEPKTSIGRDKLAAAMLALGDTENAQKLIRSAWIDGNFAKDHETQFYRKYRKYLTIGDNRERLDRLLWDGDYWPSRRMLYRVDAEYRKLAEARMALRRKVGNVDRLISLVPEELRDDPGLVYERLRWRRRAGKPSATEFLEDLPKDVPNPDRWWDERSVIARRLLQKGFVSEAYRVAAEHRLTPDHAADHAEAEWLSGWIALRFLNEPETAAKHFKTMFDAVSYPVSRSRGAYWAARAAEAAKKKDEREKWLKEAAAHPTSYYGQLAIAALRPGEGLKLPPEASVPADVEKRFEKEDMVRAVRLLAAAGEQERLRPFILALANKDPSPAWQTLTARLARLNARPDLAIRVTKDALNERGAYVPGGYPTLVPPSSKRAKLPAPLVLAIVRQESAFDKEAISSAGARGLMQLMPATAKSISKSAGVGFSLYRLTADPDYNLTLGQSYLAGLLDDFKGSLPMAIAAYNAGPHRVRQWVRENGDPRDKEVDAVDWVEMIPLNETRNYVQRVLENLQVYRLQLAGTEVALGLAEDLHK